MSAYETDITINDLKLALSIIEVAASRGAFNPNEFTVIGGLVDKLVEAVTPPAETETLTDETVAIGEELEQLELPFDQ